MKRLLMCLLPFFMNAEVIAQVKHDDFSFAEPKDLNTLKFHNLWATQYFIHQFKSGGKISIRDEAGKTLGLFADTCDFCAAALEGTAYVTDSIGQVHVINFAGRGQDTAVNCRRCPRYSKSKLNVESWGTIRWKKSNGFGEGVKNYPLIPFRTVAVDSSVIPYGTILFVPEAKNAEITVHNGKKVKHDGYFIAADKGGAIKNNHIDVFTGISNSNPFISFVTSDPKKTFKAYIVSEAPVQDFFRRILQKAD